MPRLDFYCDLKPFLSVRLVSGDLLIGRAPDCTVQLLGAKVSRHHAQIRESASGHEIVDLSRNGTRVNTAWVRGAQPLAAGDRIYLGSRVIVYQPDEAPVAALQHDPTVIDA